MIFQGFGRAHPSLPHIPTNINNNRPLTKVGAGMTHLSNGGRR